MSYSIPHYIAQVVCCLSPNNDTTPSVSSSKVDDEVLWTTYHVSKQRATPRPQSGGTEAIVIGAGMGIEAVVAQLVIFDIQEGNRSSVPSSLTAPYPSLYFVVLADVVAQFEFLVRQIASNVHYHVERARYGLDSEGVNNGNNKITVRYIVPGMSPTQRSVCYASKQSDGNEATIIIISNYYFCSDVLHKRISLELLAAQVILLHRDVDEVMLRAMGGEGRGSGAIRSSASIGQLAAIVQPFAFTVELCLDAQSNRKQLFCTSPFISSGYGDSYSDPIAGGSHVNSSVVLPQVRFVSDSPVNISRLLTAEYRVDTRSVQKMLGISDIFLFPWFRYDIVRLREESQEFLLASGCSITADYDIQRPFSMIRLQVENIHVSFCTPKTNILLALLQSILEELLSELRDEVSRVEGTFGYLYGKSAASKSRIDTPKGDTSVATPSDGLAQRKMISQKETKTSNGDHSDIFSWQGKSNQHRKGTTSDTSTMSYLPASLRQLSFKNLSFAHLRDGHKTGLLKELREFRSRELRKERSGGASLDDPAHVSPDGISLRSCARIVSSLLDVLQLYFLALNAPPAVFLLVLEDLLRSYDTAARNTLVTRFDKGNHLPTNGRSTCKVFVGASRDLSISSMAMWTMSRHYEGVVQLAQERVFTTEKKASGSQDNVDGPDMVIDVDSSEGCNVGSLSPSSTSDGCNAVMVSSPVGSDAPTETIVPALMEGCPRLRILAKSVRNFVMTDIKRRHYRFTETMQKRNIPHTTMSNFRSEIPATGVVVIVKNSATVREFSDTLVAHFEKKEKELAQREFCRFIASYKNYTNKYTTQQMESEMTSGQTTVNNPSTYKTKLLPRKRHVRSDADEADSDYQMPWSKDKGLPLHCLIDQDDDIQDMATGMPLTNMKSQKSLSQLSALQQASPGALFGCISQSSTVGWEALLDANGDYGVGETLSSFTQASLRTIESENGLSPSDFTDTGSVWERACRVAESCRDDSNISGPTQTSSLSSLVPTSQLLSNKANLYLIALHDESIKETIRNPALLSNIKQVLSRETHVLQMASCPQRKAMEKFLGTDKGSAGGGISSETKRRDRVAAHGWRRSKAKSTDDQAVDNQEMEADWGEEHSLRRPDDVLIDLLSQALFGPSTTQPMSEQRQGTEDLGEDEAIVSVEAVNAEGCTLRVEMRREVTSDEVQRERQQNRVLPTPDKVSLSAKQGSKLKKSVAKESSSSCVVDLNTSSDSEDSDGAQAVEVEVSSQAPTGTFPIITFVHIIPEYYVTIAKVAEWIRPMYSVHTDSRIAAYKAVPVSRFYLLDTPAATLRTLEEGLHASAFLSPSARTQTSLGRRNVKIQVFHDAKEKGGSNTNRNTDKETPNNSSQLQQDQLIELAAFEALMNAKASLVEYTSVSRNSKMALLRSIGKGGPITNKGVHHDGPGIKKAPRQLSVKARVHAAMNATPNKSDESLSPNVSTTISNTYSKQSVPVVVIDDRELRSTFPYYLFSRGLKLIPITLADGDYVLSPNCALERKSFPDFCGSVNKGRLQDQLHRLSKRFSHPILLLEDSGFNPVLQRGIWARGFRFSYSIQTDSGTGSTTAPSAMISLYKKLMKVLLANPKVSWMWSMSPEHSASMVMRLKQPSLFNSSNKYNRGEIESDLNSSVLHNVMGTGTSHSYPMRPSEYIAIETPVITDETLTSKQEGAIDESVKIAMRILLQLPGVTPWVMVPLMSRCGSLAGLACMSFTEIETVFVKAINDKMQKEKGRNIMFSSRENGSECDMVTDAKHRAYLLYHCLTDSLVSF